MNSVGWKCPGVPAGVIQDFQFSSCVILSEFFSGSFPRRKVKISFQNSREDTDPFPHFSQYKELAEISDVCMAWLAGYHWWFDFLRTDVFSPPPPPGSNPAGDLMLLFLLNCSLDLGKVMCEDRLAVGRFTPLPA